MRHRLLGPGAVVTAGVAVELGSQFIRTIMLARLLSPTEFGLVIAINTFYSLVEMVSFIGVDRYLIYSSEGSQRHTLDVAHTLVLLRGVVTSALLAVSAYPTAAVLGQPRATGSFVAIAIVPLLGSISHLGIIQIQRSGKFLPSALCSGLSAIIGLAAAGMAARILADYRAIVWGLLAQSSASMILSHLLSHGRPYRLSVDLPRMQDALKFGLPLTANGIALAISSQLDRLVVGAWLGVAALGLYGLTATLLLQPMSLLLRVSTTVLQPPMSDAWHVDRSGRFFRYVRQVTIASGMLGSAGATATACLGAPLLALIFANRFAVSDLTFVLLAVTLFLRPSRFALNLFGLAIGKTADLMISNLAGAVGLATTVVALCVHPTIDSAFLGLLVSEAASLAVLSMRLRHSISDTGRYLIRVLAPAVFAPAIISIWVVLSAPGLMPRVSVTVLDLAVVGLVTWRKFGYRKPSVPEVNPAQAA